MIIIRRTEQFREWLKLLRDTEGKAKIMVRIDRMELGNKGDAAPIGKGLSEMRIHHGPGYLVYFVNHGLSLVTLLCGGDKSSQKKDIKTAQELAKSLPAIYGIIK